MIPKVIHGCWSGGPMTPLAERCLASWRRFAPDFEIRVRAAAAEDAALTPAFWSDRERFRALYEEGGVYFDLDVELVAPIGDLLDREWCAGEWLPDGSARANPGSGIALAKGSPVAKAMLDYYAEHGFDRKTTVGEVFERVCPGRPPRLPPEVFSPVDGAGRLCRTGATRGIHWYAMSWSPLRNRLARWLAWHGARPLLSLLVRLKNLI